MTQPKKKINFCEQSLAPDCPRKKAFEKEGKFKLQYHWQKVAGWSKLAGGVIKKNNERRF